jgi:hypothetical protein
MAWVVRFHDEFEAEFSALDLDVQNALLAHAKVLGTVGPTLGRPVVDTLAGSKHANMKELRFQAADGVWRVAFAFDPAREGILLVAGDKAGVAQSRFYKSLIEKADGRFDRHLETLQTTGKGK